MFSFFQSVYMRVMRDQKSQPQVVTGYYLNGGDNHSPDCFKVFKTSTGAIWYSREMIWRTLAPPWWYRRSQRGMGGESTSSAAAPTPPELPDVSYHWYVPTYAAPPCVQSPPTVPPPLPLPPVESPPPPSPDVSSPEVSPMPQHVARELGLSRGVQMSGRKTGQSRVVHEEKASSRVSRNRLSPP